MIYICVCAASTCCSITPTSSLKVTNYTGQSLGKFKLQNSGYHCYSSNRLPTTGMLAMNKKPNTWSKKAQFSNSALSCNMDNLNTTKNLNRSKKRHQRYLYLGYMIPVHRNLQICYTGDTRLFIWWSLLPSAMYTNEVQETWIAAQCTMGNMKLCNNAIFQTDFGSFLERGSGLLYPSVNCETQRTSVPIHVLGALFIFSCDDIDKSIQLKLKNTEVSQDTLGNVLTTRTNISDTSLQSHGWTSIIPVKQWDLVWI